MFMDHPNFWHFSARQTPLRLRDIPSDLRRRPWSSDAAERALAAARNTTLIDWSHAYYIWASLCLSPVSLAVLAYWLWLGGPSLRPQSMIQDRPEIYAVIAVCVTISLVACVCTVLSARPCYRALMRDVTLVGCVDRHMVALTPIVIRWGFVTVIPYAIAGHAVLTWRGGPGATYWLFVVAMIATHAAWTGLIARGSVTSLHRAAELTRNVETNTPT